MKRNRDESTVIVWLLTILVVSAIAATFVVAFQTYVYLKSAEWPSISVLMALQWARIGWARNPTDWLGLYELLGNLSLAPSLSIGGSVPVFVWYLFNRD